MRMIGNYLQIAVRILRRHKLLSIIEVCSLSLAFGFCVLAYTLVSHEWSYDRFHENGAYLYRVVLNFKFSDHERKRGDNTPVAMAEAIQNSVPQVEETVRLVSGRYKRLDLRRIRVRLGDTWNDEPFLLVDENFFEVFTFPFEAGDPQTALQAKDGVVVSSTFARRYFGDEPAVGQTVRIDVGWPKSERKEYTIQGVVAPPANSSIQLNILLPFHNSEFLWRWIDDFWDHESVLFVRLREDANKGDLKQAEALIRQLYIENVPDFGDRLAARKGEFSVELQPLSALHTDPDVTQSNGYDGVALPRDPLETYIVLAIAVLLLAVAVVNYVNLATARASARGLEVGVRVALGATRRQLPVQFWMETMVVCGVSLLTGLGLGEVLLPAFNSVLGQDLRLDYTDPSFIIGGLGLLVLTSLLAAAYPGLVMARINPSEAVRGTSLLSHRSVLGSALVMVQFAACAGLAGMSLVMARQLHHLQTFDLGFAADDVLMLRIEVLPQYIDSRQRQLLKEGLLTHSGIKAVAMSAYNFLEAETPWLRETTLPGEDRTIRAQYLRVDPHFVETLGLQLVQGSDLGSDQAGILVNETYVARAGWDQPIGQVVLGRKMPNGEGRVVGVLNDYYFYSLKSGVEPGVLLLDSNIRDQELLFVRLDPRAGHEVIEHIEREWKAVAPDDVLYLSWLEDHLAAYYRDDIVWLRIVGGSALLAVFIAALGAYGLTAITVSHQRRNIAFMRTLGAQGRHVAGLLARRLLWLVLAGCVLIGPIAHLGVEEWLSQFSQRIDDGWVFLGLGSLAAAATACAGVLLHTAALMREPLVKGLKSE